MWESWDIVIIRANNNETCSSLYRRVHRHSTGIWGSAVSRFLVPSLDAINGFTPLSCHLSVLCAFLRFDDRSSTRLCKIGLAPALMGITKTCRRLLTMDNGSEIFCWICFERWCWWIKRHWRHFQQNVWEFLFVMAWRILLLKLETTWIIDALYQLSRSSTCSTYAMPRVTSNKVSVTWQ